MDTYRQTIFLLPKAPFDSRVHPRDDVSGGGGPRARLCPGTSGQAWSPEEVGVGQPLIPEAGGVARHVSLP